MNTIKRLSVVFAIIIAATISSCAGSDDDPAPGSPIPATGSYINATADGSAFTTVMFGQSTAITSRTGTGSTGLITVSGSTVDITNPTNSKTIVISLLGITAAGTYALNAGSNSVLAYAVGSGSTGIAYVTGNCTGATGSVTVTSLSTTKIEGTFSFTGKNELCTVTKSITAGTFRGIFN